MQICYECLKSWQESIPCWVWLYSINLSNYIGTCEKVKGVNKGCTTQKNCSNLIPQHMQSRQPQQLGSKIFSAFILYQLLTNKLVYPINAIPLGTCEKLYTTLVLLNPITTLTQLIYYWYRKGFRSLGLNPSQHINTADYLWKFLCMLRSNLQNDIRAGHRAIPGLIFMAI